jgi:hypothetical protein
MNASTAHAFGSHDLVLARDLDPDAFRQLQRRSGETLSRLAIVRLGFPEPLLQTRHVNPRGGFYLTDHEWPEYKAIGEFDGYGKYLKRALKPGEDAGRVVYEEKIREDHLRDEGNGVARWGAPELRNPEEIARRLLRIGVPRSEAPSRTGRQR